MALYEYKIYHECRKYITNLDKKVQGILDISSSNS